MAVLMIAGWRAGLRKVGMTKALRQRLKMDLSGAKTITDEVLDGKTISLEIEDREEARSLAAELAALGAIVKIED